MLELKLGFSRYLLMGTIPLCMVALSVEARSATPTCASLNVQNPVYLQIGDTQEPLIKALGRKLRDSSKNITLFYYTSPSCTNAKAISSNPVGTMPVTVKYVPSTAEASPWTTADASLTCTLPVQDGGTVSTVPIDIANSNIFVSACSMTLPTGVGTFYGSIQPYVFIAPKASTQTALTAEEGYLLLGADSALSPWGPFQSSDAGASPIFIRGATASTTVSVAANLNVPPGKLKGQAMSSSQLIMDNVSGSTSPEATLGILGAELYDQHRDTLKSLAFQAYGQSGAFYPDSTSTARDKRNLRDGHYAIWSPTVYMTAVDGTGAVPNANLKYVLDLIQGKNVTTEFDPLSLIISVGLVPECAMRVQRSKEGGDLSFVAPDDPCGCYFESQTGTTTCASCDGTHPCASGTCHYGYCEPNTCEAK